MLGEHLPSDFSVLIFVSTLCYPSCVAYDLCIWLRHVIIYHHSCICFMALYGLLNIEPWVSHMKNSLVAVQNFLVPSFLIHPNYDADLFIILTHLWLIYCMVVQFLLVQLYYINFPSPGRSPHLSLAAGWLKMMAPVVIITCPLLLRCTPLSWKFLGGRRRAGKLKIRSCKLWCKIWVDKVMVGNVKGIPLSWPPTLLSSLGPRSL